MPQSVTAETELKHLAAVPYQLVSPSKNSPLTGIYQDSLLGSYRFTRPNIKFSHRDAMNLLMSFNNVNIDVFKNKKDITNFDILSQILPPITLKYKTKLYDEDEDFSTSNNVLEIRNGNYIRGQIEKSVLASTTKGIIHRIGNDYNNVRSIDFIDDMQNIITEYMKSSSFSVGISDLIANKKTQDAIIQAIAKQKHEVQTIIEKVHLGIFENNTASTNIEEFENSINKQLNKANEEAGKIGRKSLNKDNRFLMIVNSGSKGSLINISQMISCLGQTNVDGKRIPYGYDSRTLPHFNKFDDSPIARGFIENSYISGLTAPELFFHAMGGRIGLIDTACKSVTWETPIVFIENNEPKYMEIGKWIDEKLEKNKDQIKHYTDRQMELLDVDGIYIPTTDENGVVTWGEVTAMTRHDPGDQLYEIKTDGGRSVIVTESKSLLIWNKESKKLLETSTPDIKVGDYVPVTAKLHTPPVVYEDSHFDIDMIIQDIRNGVFSNDLFMASTRIVRNIINKLFERKNSKVIFASEKVINGVAMLLTRDLILCTINKEELSITIETNNDKVVQDIVLDKIKEINIVSTDAHPKVYDLTIPSTLNFGLANGLQVRDTSSTGYIQRRLIKGLEDLRVEYDMTVRNNMGKIIQFAYGDDGFDSTRVENQIIPVVGMSIEDIYSHYDIVGVNDQLNDMMNVYTKGTQTRVTKQRVEAKAKCMEYINQTIKYQDSIVKQVFQHKNENTVKIPVAFQNIIANIQGQMSLNSNSIVDITPLEAFKLIEEYYEKLNNIHYVKPNLLFKALYYFYLNPKDLLVNKRFHKAALTLLLETILLKYKQAIVHPGEMVGVVAGQGIGEPTTQLSTLRSERLKIIRINKTSGVPEMISGEIGTICDKLIAELPEYTFETGHKDSVETLLEPLDDEYYIVGVDEQEKTHWNKISHVSRHIVNGDMIRVKTKSGRVVVTTLSHSHLIRKDQKVQPILGSDMKVGMRIPVAKHIDNTFVQKSVEIDGKMYQLDHLFGWFIGAYLAEGCLVKKKGKMEANGTISISNVSDYYVENTKKIAARFNRECRVNHKTGHILNSEKTYTNTDTSFTFKPLADLIMQTCGTGSFVKRVPDFAFLAPNEFKAGLISGYFDGDGNFMCDKIHHTIRVLSRSEQLIKDISLLLSYFDIFGSLHTNYRNGANYYHLAISPKYAKIYQENIGSNLHKEKLQNLVDYNERTDTFSLREDIDKINGLGEIIAKCGKILELPGQSRNYGRWKKKESIGRSTLQKYIEIFKTHEKATLIHEELSILQQAATAGVIWDEVVEIVQYTPDQTEYVYDFTVPGNQTFMNDFGIIVHNTLNSVTYETEILVRDDKGRLNKVQIGKFTEEHIKKSKKIDYIEAKDTTYAELSEYYEVPSATENGETVWRRIEAVTQHPVINKDGTNTMLKITTKGCRDVTVTKAKSLLQLVDGKIQEVEGSSVKLGDYLPVSRKQLEFTEVHQFNLRSILSPKEYIYGSEMEKAKAVIDEHQWWMKHANKTFTIPYNRSDSAYASIKKTCRKGDHSVDYESGFVYTKTNNICNYKVPEVIDLDYDFGYLLGAYCAEGCMTAHQVSIANIDEDYYKPILRVCEKFNLTTKVYTHQNKGKEGWTSKDIRIYSTLLCRILDNLCGKLSHNKYISDCIIFSNKECIQGFLDAYLSGDGTIKCNKESSITATSTSYKLLLGVQIMMKQLGVTAKIRMGTVAIKDVEFPTYTTKLENIHQTYILSVTNHQCNKLANLLSLSIKNKQDKILELREKDFKLEYCRGNLLLPNIINGFLCFEERKGKMMDLEFDQIVSIEEVSNTTSYAYDLTVEDTKNFDLYNGICVRDTFHNAGVASKSNVTRGVPRIEEILRLTKNPKNPSLTVHMKPLDELEKDKAVKYAKMLEHTKLINVVKSIQICFDPNDRNTLILDDKQLLEQYYEFENMMEECTNEPIQDPLDQRSKWIIRMEMDAEAMLDKNITMDDIHFAIGNSHGADVACIYSDYNASNLVFRLRLSKNIFNKKKAKGTPEALDQSDEIYMLRNFQDSLLNNIVLRGVEGIRNVAPRKLQNNVIKEDGKYVQKDIWILDTTGTNLMEIMALDYIDGTRTTSNDIKEVFDVLGIEAARQIIYSEFVDVMEFSDVYINYHHLSLLADRMTSTKSMVSIFRSGILNDDIGPISKASFEVHTEVLLDAARYGDIDYMRGVSANVMLGQHTLIGTNAFQVVLDMNKMHTMEGLETDVKDKNKEMEKLFGGLQDPTDVCAKNKIEIENNLTAIKQEEIGKCEDDNYDMGF